MRLRSQASRSFAPLATLLQRYPDMAAACNPTGQPLSGAWSGLHGAQIQYSASLALAGSRPLDAAAMDALAAADHVLQMAWLRVMEDNNSPDTPSVSEALAQQWQETGQQVRQANQAFSHDIEDYNHAIQQFPALLLALLFGFRSAKPLNSVAPPSSHIPL